jgi:Cu2+-exporting ATPase
MMKESNHEGSAENSREHGSDHRTGSPDQHAVDSGTGSSEPKASGREGDSHANDHGGHGDHHRHMVEDFKRRFWVSLILSLPIVALAPMIQEWLGVREVLAFGGSSYVQFALSSLVFFYGGWPFLKGLVDEVRQAQPGMMTLIALAILVAYIYSSAVVFGVPGKTFFWELSTLIVVMLLGHWIEMRSVMGASRALDELAKLMPKDAHRLKEDGSTVDVPVSELDKGDSILIKPGEKIPADGEIVEGNTSVDESVVTGESEPVSKEAGDQVTGGAVNGDGSITVEVRKVGKDSFLSQVMSMVEQAQRSKSKTQRLADRAAFWLTMIALTAGVITMIVWLGFFHREFVFALERTVTVMVITCPHALGLAIPLVVAVSTALSARSGLLIRQRGPFERARDIDTIIFDKTGTLTQGKFMVSEVLVLSESMEKKEVLRLAAGVESRSEHPIARAIVAEVEKPPSSEDFEAMKGKGARGKVDGKEVRVVSPSYLEEQDLKVEDSRAADINTQGKTVAYVLVDGNIVGAISLEDPVREEAHGAVNRLKKKGIRVMMLTGDNNKVAERVAGELGLDEYFAEVLPDKKADKVKEVQSGRSIVAMVGDGVNDAPALAQADVGIAIGAGTDVAAESADIVLVKSNPLDVVKTIEYSKATYRKMIQNLIWATGYNAIALPLAAGALYSLGILLSPAVGALLMSLSTVIVAINARFLKVPEIE